MTFFRAPVFALSSRDALAVPQVVQMGPFQQRAQVRCPVSNGTGLIFKEQTTPEVLEVHIPKGAPNGHKLKFSETDLTKLNSKSLRRILRKNYDTIVSDLNSTNLAHQLVVW